MYTRLLCKIEQVCHHKFSFCVSMHKTAKKPLPDLLDSFVMYSKNQRKIILNILFLRQFIYWLIYHLCIPELKELAKVLTIQSKF